MRVTVSVQVHKQHPRPALLRLPHQRGADPGVERRVDQLCGKYYRSQENISCFHLTGLLASSLHRDLAEAAVTLYLAPVKMEPIDYRCVDIV